jgi:integrase
MSKQLKAVLNEYKAKEKKRAFKQGLGKLPELVFHRDGQVIEQNYIRRVFKRVLSRAGLREIKLHGLRHTYASMLASSGQVDMYTLQKLLTHKSPQMTQRYAHLRDEALRRAANLAGDLINQAVNSQEVEQEKPEQGSAG